MSTDTRPVPELAPEAVEQWRTEGAELVDLLARARRGVGGIAAFRLGPEPTVLVTDPAAVQHVLGRHPDRYVKRSHRARMLVGDGVLSATGDAWKRQRRLLQSQFTGTGMRRYEQRIAAAARRTAERWAGYRRSGETFDVGEEMRRFALDTVWRALTGLPLDDRTDRELRAVERVVAAMPKLPTDAADARDAVAEDLALVDAVAHAAIDAAREAGPTEEPGVLRVLLEAGDQIPAYTDRLIRDELVTLLVAGHETTATTLTWLFLLLDEHPEARTADPQALVSETLRLYPSAWLLPRHATQDDVIEGHHIAAGTDVLVCPYLIHRDPALWPDPERFDPARFAPGAERPGHLGAYLPFGLGARACLGTQFALRETTALLELLLPMGELAYVSKPKGAAYSITVRPDGPSPAVLR
ncbi:cytochrome P450 [Kitasatospora xanthocidica]|uniref:cytochrome P450 n=1 Tax=Kitasatospora xanthocidica TaxID=83382 RepID=UPI00167C0817|nr:cytochrome P450 [Kitasatospora xanthocidica]GHF69786.1 cytochrome P450 [Kitasatospora xanthocidica]